MVLTFEIDFLKNHSSNTSFERLQELALCHFFLWKSKRRSVAFFLLTFFCSVPVFRLSDPYTPPHIRGQTVAWVPWVYSMTVIQQLSFWTCTSLFYESSMNKRENKSETENQPLSCSTTPSEAFVWLPKCTWVVSETFARRKIPQNDLFPANFLKPIHIYPTKVVTGLVPLTTVH